MQINITNKRPKQTAISTSNWIVVVLILSVLLLALYYIIRFDGHWAENDSAVFSSYIRSMLRDGQLDPSTGDVYPNGYGFQAISAYIVALTGLDVATLQQIIYPLFAALIVLPAWLLYRELTDSVKGATLATILLFAQPEFLFVILRSSHEKFTRILLLLSLYWLVRSFKLRHRFWLLVGHVVLFYFTTYAMIACNNLISNSFIFAVTSALILGWLLTRVKRHLQPLAQATLQRLTY